MVQLIRNTKAFFSRPGDCRGLLLALLLGSVFGALCAKLHLLLGFSPDPAVTDPSWFSSLLAACLFPVLLCAAALLGRPRLFCGLFFCKGLAVTDFLVLLAAAGELRLMAGALVRNLLPLPALLFAASVWLEQGREPRLWLLVFPLAACLLGTCLQGLF